MASRTDAAQTPQHTRDPMPPRQARACADRLRANVERALKGKPETVRRKGSSTPLIDTKQMANSITHKARNV